MSFIIWTLLCLIRKLFINYSKIENFENVDDLEKEDKSDKIMKKIKE